MAKDPVCWRDAPELHALARPIIAAHHPHLEGIPLRIVWRSEMRKLRGALAAGTCEIVSGRFAFFVMTEEEAELAEDAGCPGKMFWIEIAADYWETLDDAGRLALLDHELAHAGVSQDETKEGIQLEVKVHDVEEFVAIVERHGPWDKPLLSLVSAADVWAASMMFE